MIVYWNVLDQCLRYLTNTLGYTYLKLCDSLLGGEPLGVAGTYERSLFSACVVSPAFWKEHKRMGSRVKILILAKRQTNMKQIIYRKQIFDSLPFFELLALFWSELFKYSGF